MSQASPDIFCMQISMISIKITSLYGSQPLCVVFTCKTATFGHELLDSIGPSPLLCFFIQNSGFWTSIQVSMGTRPHLSFYAYKTAWLASEILVSMGSSHHLWFCAYKTAWLAPELLVSIDPSPHVWLLDAKQRLLDWNKKSPRDPDITCRIVHAKQRD